MIGMCKLRKVNANLSIFILKVLRCYFPKKSRQWGKIFSLNSLLILFCYVDSTRIHMKSGYIDLLRVRLYYIWKMIYASSLRCRQKYHGRIILRGGIAKSCMMVGWLHLNSMLPNKVSQTFSENLKASFRFCNFEFSRKYSSLWNHN